MTVDLEKLVIKSVEQYAAINVQLASMQQAVDDIRRRNEKKEDQFIAACEKISRLEDKLSIYTEEKKTIIKKLESLKDNVETLDEQISEYSNTFHEHQSDHCNGCKHETKIRVLDEKIESLENPDKDLKEVRAIVTSKWMIFVLRTLNSRYGQIFIASLIIMLLLSIYTHYELVVKIYKILTLNPQ